MASLTTNIRHILVSKIGYDITFTVSRISLCSLLTIKMKKKKLFIYSFTQRPFVLMNEMRGTFGQRSNKKKNTHKLKKSTNKLK